MMQNGYTEIIAGLAKVGLASQVSSSHTGADGFLVCDVCGKKKQSMIRVGDRDILVAVTCKCDDAARESRKAREEQDRMHDLARRMRRMSLMDAKYANATFSQFRETEYNAWNLKLCRSYANRFDEMMAKNQGMIMFGPCGTGKSFAAACIANELLNKHVPVVMTSFIKLLSSFQQFGEEPDELVNLLNDAHLVIFDDLGAERKTDFALERIYDVIDNRYRSNKPMIVTTNLTLEEMTIEEDIRLKRIYDRLFESCCPMQFEGPSWRAAKMGANWEKMQKFLEG